MQSDPNFIKTKQKSLSLGIIHTYMCVYIKMPKENYQNLDSGSLSLNGLIISGFNFLLYTFLYFPCFCRKQNKKMALCSEKKLF